MAINQSIPTFTTTPNRNNPATFSADTDTYHQELAPFTGAINTWSSEANQTAEDVNNDATTASNAATSAIASASLASSSANNKGLWSDLTGALSIPASVSHNDKLWILNVNLADVTLSEPSGVNSDWTLDSGVTINDTTPSSTETYSSNKIETELALKLNKNNPIITGGFTEQIATISDLTIETDDVGTVLERTMVANDTFIDNLANGQSCIFKITTAGYEPSFPINADWVGNEKVFPTTNTIDYLGFLKVGADLKVFDLGEEV